MGLIDSRHTFIYEVLRPLRRRKASAVIRLILQKKKTKGYFLFIGKMRSRFVSPRRRVHRRPPRPKLYAKAY